MVEVNNDGLWDFALGLLEKYPIFTMVLTGLFAAPCFIWLCWVVYKKIKGDNHLEKISKDVNSIKNYIIKE